MKAYGGVGVYIHIFLTSVLAGGEWSVSRPCRFTPGERAAGTHWIRDWVDPRVSLDNVEKRRFLTLPGLELRPLGRPSRSQSLYRLSYPGSFTNAVSLSKGARYTHWIWGSHGSEYDDCGLVGCNSLQSGVRTTFRRTYFFNLHGLRVCGQIWWK
jgi:hypothetical protein